MSTLLAITQEVHDASTRYRVGLYLLLMERAGVKTTIVPWPREKGARLELIESAGEYDAVVVQRRLLPVGMARRLRQRARRLSYDFDDAVMYRDSTRGRPWPLLDKWLQFRALVSQCDAITPGNAYLAELASRFAPTSRIEIVPTVVDVGRYPARAKDESGSDAPVVGWIGSRSTLPYLQSLYEPLKRVAERFPGLVIRVIADAAPVFPGLNVELRRWAEETEAADMQSLTVGLSPLPDDKWTRGKCGLRLLQYLAAGVPAIASPVGVQKDLTESTGLPASNAEEWAAFMTHLLSTPAARATLQETGRRLVEEKYTPEKVFATVHQAWMGRPGRVG